MLRRPGLHKEVAGKLPAKPVEFWDSGVYFASRKVVPINVLSYRLESVFNGINHLSYRQVRRAIFKLFEFPVGFLSFLSFHFSPEPVDGPVTFPIFGFCRWRPN